MSTEEQARFIILEKKVEQMHQLITVAVTRDLDIADRYLEDFYAKRKAYLDTKRAYIPISVDAA